MYSMNKAPISQVVSGLKDPNVVLTVQLIFLKNGSQPEHIDRKLSKKSQTRENITMLEPNQN